MCGVLGNFEHAPLLTVQTGSGITRTKSKHPDIIDSDGYAMTHMYSMQFARMFLGYIWQIGDRPGQISYIQRQRHISDSQSD